MVNPYLPSGIWYDYYKKTAIESKGERFNLSAPLDTIPILVRGGYVIPQQSALPTTTESRKSKIQLLAAGDASESASGLLYWDDGDSLSKYIFYIISLFYIQLCVSKYTAKQN